MGLPRSLVIKTTGALARGGRIANSWKGGCDLMGWAKGSGAAAGITINIYGSSDPGTPSGTGNMGDGSSVVVDDQSKQTLLATVHPTTGATGATGINAVLLNQVFWFDYLFVEFVTAEGTTNQCELTISGRDA